MKQHEVPKGSRLVCITKQGPRRFAAHLYVNNGETATMTHWQGKTLKGAQAWALKTLAR